METAGIWIGIVDEIGEMLKVGHLSLDPGDVMLLYTDGIVERFNPDHQEYGIERLRRQLGRCCVGSPSQTVDAIMADVDRFAGSHPPDDDQTVLLGLLE